MSTTITIHFSGDVIDDDAIDGFVAEIDGLAGAEVTITRTTVPLIESETLQEVLEELNITLETQFEIFDALGLNIPPEKVYFRQFLLTVVSGNQFSRSKDLNPALGMVGQIPGVQDWLTTSCSDVEPNGDYRWQPAALNTFNTNQFI